MVPWQLPIGDFIEYLVKFIRTNFPSMLEAITKVVKFAVNLLDSALTIPPPYVIVVVFVIIAWWVRGNGFAIFTAFGFLLIQAMGLWKQSMDTLALVLTATIIAALISIPIGILSARNDKIALIARPVLDFMQTMPAFVYLIPAIIFFGLKEVPGVLATVVFSIPPAIRLTDLGIRQVPGEVIEAARAFGSTPNQILLKVQVPMALPTIMAGINQMIMLALSMVVIAGMIGAGGLGAIVLQGISTLDIGLGFEGGLAIVLIAIFLDRLTEALGKKGPARSMTAKS